MWKSKELCLWLFLYFITKGSLYVAFALTMSREQSTNTYGTKKNEWCLNYSLDKAEEEVFKSILDCTRIFCFLVIVELYYNCLHDYL